MTDNTYEQDSSHRSSLPVMPYLSPIRHPLICLLVPWKQDLGWGAVYDEMRQDYMAKRPTTLFSNSPVHQQWLLHILNTRHREFEETAHWEHTLASALTLSLYNHDIPQLYIPHLTIQPRSTYIFDKLSTSGMHNLPRVPTATYAITMDVRCAHPEQSDYLAVALKFITRGLPAALGVTVQPCVAGLTYVFQPNGVTCVIFCTSDFDEVYKRTVEECTRGSANAYMTSDLHYGPSPHAVMEFPANRLPGREITDIHHRAIDLAIW